MNESSFSDELIERQIWRQTVKVFVLGVGGVEGSDDNVKPSMNIAVGAVIM